MTTLTLQIENKTILAHLKEVLKAIDGVKVLNMSDNASEEVLINDETPNAVTLQAMRDAENGNDEAVCMDSVQSFMESILK